MKKVIAALMLVALTASVSATLVNAADNMAFKGTLRAHACTLHPDDRAIQIDFLDLGTHSLYLYGGTADQRFDIRLLNCNVNVASDVQVTFQGTPNNTIPGALALDASSQAAGFAIVLKDAAKQQLNLGDMSSSPIVGADTTLEFYRRVQVEPDALVNRGIVPGVFTASATFELFYP
ncbi:fimbrial protein [Acinetobacter vivianii]|uniref:Fimbrial protein n=1 Tax=Acinetobacter vivianii TaxID=1776742 RepID=A0AAJ6NJY0_9GAMM|nr:fimbrial protein [Acinetobacter vivianii]WDZ51802.1 fimbrial protein [Acinetobacter vivianii]